MPTTTIANMTRAKYTRTRYLEYDGTTINIMGSVTQARTALMAWADMLTSSIRSAVQAERLLRGVEGLHRIKASAQTASRLQWARKDDAGVLHVVDLGDFGVNIVSTYDVAPDVAALCAKPVIPLDEVADALRQGDTSSNVITVLLHVLPGESRVTHRRTITSRDTNIVMPIVQIAVESTRGYDIADDLNRLEPVGGTQAAVLAYAVDNVVLIGIDAGPMVFNATPPPQATLALQSLARDIRDAVTIYTQAYVAEHAVHEPARPEFKSETDIVEALSSPMQAELTAMKTTLNDHSTALQAALSDALSRATRHACVVRELESDLLPNLDAFLASFVHSLSECAHAQFRGLTITDHSIDIDAGEICTMAHGPAADAQTSLKLPLHLTLAPRVTYSDEIGVMVSFVPSHVAVVGHAIQISIPEDEQSLALARRWNTNPASALNLYIDHALQAVSAYLAAHPITLA